MPFAELEYACASRCASVVKVSDYAVRRVKALSLPIVLGSTFELDDSKHGARLHEKAEAPYADGDGYVYARWGSPTNEGAARQVARLAKHPTHTNTHTRARSAFVVEKSPSRLLRFGWLRYR